MKPFFASVCRSPHRRYLCAFIILFILLQSPAIISSLLQPLIITLISKSANATGIELSISDSIFQFPGSLTLSNIHLKSQKSPTPPIHLNRLDAKIKSIFPLRIYLKAEFLEGDIQCDVEPQAISLNSSVVSTCIVNNINVAAYAPIYAAGIKGIIDGSVNAKFNEEDASNNRIDLSIGLSKGYFDSINKGLFDTPSSPISKFLKLPPITDLQIQLKGIIKEIEFNIEQAEIVSNMGTVSNLTGILKKQGTSLPSDISLEFNGILQLSDLGVKHLAPWLALRLNNQKFNKEPLKLILLKPLNRELDLRVSR